MQARASSGAPEASRQREPKPETNQVCSALEQRVLAGDVLKEVVAGRRLIQTPPSFLVPFAWRETVRKRAG